MIRWQAPFCLNAVRQSRCAVRSHKPSEKHLGFIIKQRSRKGQGQCRSFRLSCSRWGLKESKCFRYSSLRRSHDELLSGFDGQLEALASVELHSTACTASVTKLIHLVDAPKLRALATEHQASHDNLAQKVRSHLCNPLNMTLLWCSHFGEDMRDGAVRNYVTMIGLCHAGS